MISHISEEGKESGEKSPGEYFYVFVYKNLWGFKSILGFSWILWVLCMCI